MIIIAHRGNIEGPSNHENDPEYIRTAIQEGYDVEIDLWLKEGVLYLGHDKPEYQIKEEFIMLFADNLWIHCKNLAALRRSISYNSFFHINDAYTLTSRSYIWTYPGIAEFCDRSVMVLPEQYPDLVIPNYVYGICTDYALEWRKKCLV